MNFMFSNYKFFDFLSFLFKLSVTLYCLKSDAKKCHVADRYSRKRFAEMIFTGREYEKS